MSFCTIEFLILDLKTGVPNFFLGNAENGMAEELDRAPIDAFKEKKVTFEQNHKVFGEDEKGIYKIHYNLILQHFI
jgi:hypothetical protein